jgi:hypothetical protein
MAVTQCLVEHHEDLIRHPKVEVRVRPTYRRHTEGRKMTKKLMDRMKKKYDFGFKKMSKVEKFDNPMHYLI